MICRFYIIILSSLFLISGTYAQNADVIDSLRQILSTATKEEKADVLNDMAYAYYESDTEKSLNYSDSAMILSQKLGYKKGEAKALNNMGLVYRIRSEFDRAQEFHNKALEIYKDIKDTYGIAQTINGIGLVYLDKGLSENAGEQFDNAIDLYLEINNKKGLAHAYNNLAITYFSEGYVEKSLKFYYKALKLSEELNLKKNIALIYNNIGLINWKMGHYNKAFENYKRALQICTDLNNKHQSAVVLNNLGLISGEIDQIDKALHYFDRSLKLKKELNDMEGIVRTRINIGEIYNRDNYTGEALKYFRSALEIATEINDEKGKCVALYNIGKVYYILELYDEARGMIRQSILIAKKIKMTDYLLFNYQVLSNLYASVKEYDKAYEYLNLFKAMNDSIYNEKNSKVIAEMQEKYELEKKEKEIVLLQKDNLIKKRDNNILTILLLGISALVLLLIYAFYLKTKSSKQKLLIYEKEKQLHKLTVEKKDFEIKHKNRELSTFALHIVHKNEILNNIKESLTEMYKDQKTIPPEFNTLLTEIDNNINLDKEWDTFKMHFEQVHHGFFEKIMKICSFVNPSELRLCAYLRINLSSKEIARLLNISPTSADKKRYRLRQKLKLDENTNLVEFMNKL